MRTPLAARKAVSFLTPPGKSPMRQDTTSRLAGLARFTRVQDMPVARKHKDGRARHGLRRHSEDFVSFQCWSLRTIRAIVRLAKRRATVCVIFGPGCDGFMRGMHQESA